MEISFDLRLYFLNEEIKEEFEKLVNTGQGHIPYST